ncbi:hypothetical protein PFISCL1PPCAC_3029, partial [Pristionchus fissidentatus]
RGTISLHWISFSEKEEPADLLLFRTLPAANTFNLRWTSESEDETIPIWWGLLIDGQSKPDPKIDTATLLNIVNKFDHVNLEGTVAVEICVKTMCEVFKIVCDSERSR